MSKFIFIVVFFILSSFAFGQRQQVSTAKSSPPVKKSVLKPKAVAALKPADPEAEKAKLNEILALTSAAERASALKRFLNDFPNSDLRARALELLVIARAIVADEKLQANESSNGIAIFKLAVAEAPTPIPERLFNEIISKFPANLFYRDQRSAALEIAEAIAKKAGGNVNQLLSLAGFYIGIESGADAKRLTEAAIVIDPNSAVAYQTLGLAHRLNFDLEESAKAYSRALELDGGSTTSKRSLAEMNRALGKSDDATALYRQILAGNENDTAARTGLILSLFGAGNKAEAESEMTKSLDQNAKNFGLLAGAAYWYAANNLGDKAVEFAQKAVELEPRYIWGHIALARGFMSQKKPVEAERVLIAARQYGNFPTLEYEIASARHMAGFYREAVEELQKSFDFKDGMVQTKLGGRVLRREKSLADLIAYERRASIFEPLAAENLESAAKLRLLVEINQKLSIDEPDETEIATLTDEFVKGDDKMKLHRQMYAAALLLQKNVALSKVLDLVKSAVGNADAGLDVATAGAAVMASELYESRTIAFARNEFILIPDVPRQTLSAILRGRIEELAGWALFQQKSYPEAIVRLRRAISVLPDKSAWWRSSLWRLGAALEADGKYKEALDSYIQSYKTDRPNVFKYGTVEALYKKVHGGTEGLESKIGPAPLALQTAAEPVKPLETIEKSVVPAAIPSKVAVSTENSVVATSSVPEKIEKPTQEIVVKADETVQPKIEEKIEPKVEDSQISEKQNETKIPATEIPLVAAEDVSKLERAKASAENLVNEKSVVETQQSEIPAEIPPAIDLPRRTESDLPVEPVESIILPTNVIDVPKVETVDPQPQPNENPTSTEPLSNESKKLLQDPILNSETPAKPPAEKMATQSNDLKIGNLSEKKLVVIVEDPVGNGKKAKGTKILFEPIIITVPGGSSSKSADKDDAAEASESKSEQTRKSADVSSGALRVRLVDGLEVKSNKQCSLNVSEENISIINGGGSLGILVNIVGEGDLKDVVATSNSPKDIEVKAEPGIEGIFERRFYVIRSVSSVIGVYQVNLESDCGKKEILVRVR